MTEQPQPDYDIALCLDEPYAAWISQGVQTIHVEVDRLPPDVLATSTVLVGDKAYGRITLLPEPQELDQKAFDSLRDAHRIDVAKQTEYARERSAWREGPFYAYTFKFEPFSAPIPYEILPDEPLEKACSRRRKIKKLTIAKAVCPECHKDPCECKKPEVCPDCGKDPCECEEEVEKSMVPDLTEHPSAYEVIINKVPDGWTLEAERHDNHFIVLMKNTTAGVTKTKIHAILFDKTLCPCAIAKIDYTPFALWTSTIYNAEYPPIPADIPLSDR